MPQNKNAHERYRIIDRCLQQTTRSWSKEELLEQIDEQLRERNPDHNSISERTLQIDLKYMASIDGYDAPITYELKNRKRYYKYADKDFRIHRSPLNELERDAIETVLSIFDRFDGAPQFDWMYKTITQLEEKLKLNRQSKREMVVFDDNIDYTGREHLRTLSKLIEQERLIEIEYQPFNEEVRMMRFHPGLLKEYNNRWFLYGWIDDPEIRVLHKPWNLPLDRMLSIIDAGESDYQPNFNWEDFFSDIIGASRMEGEPEEVEILVTKRLLPYLETKPLHGSQKPPQLQADGRYLLRFQLIPNYELEYQLLAWGEAVEVLQPQTLRQKLQNRIEQMVAQYRP